VLNFRPTINETIPADIRLKPLELEHIMTEYEFANHIRLLVATNKVYKSYIGLVTTQQFRRQFKEIFWKPSWYTAYTPYQAEIAGKIRSHFEFPNYGYWVNRNGNC
jgi:glycine dehydrogenase